jgi:hypothetical protein
MEYNTSRSRLVIPEYGRTVQKIAEYILTIEDKAERNRATLSLINIMGQVNPQPRDQAENKQKFWDHLFILTDFKLDVDCPYETPTPNSVLFTRPAPMGYIHNRIRYKHYGKNVERMLDYAVKMEEGPQKNAFVNSLASYMKMAYWMWNNDKAPDMVVIDSIREMTDGKITLREINELSAHNDTYSQKSRKDPRQHQNNFRNKNQAGGMNRNKNQNQNRPPQRNKPGGK